MKFSSLILGLAVLVSCNGTKSSSKQKQEERYTCGASETFYRTCMEPQQAILNTRLTNLPAKMRVQSTAHSNSGDLATVIADNCQRPKAITVVSNSTGSSIFFKTFFNLLSAPKFTIEIIDLGEDCKGSTVVIRSEHILEDVRRGEDRTLNLDLD